MTIHENFDFRPRPDLKTDPDMRSMAAAGLNELFEDAQQSRNPATVIRRGVEDAAETAAQTAQRAAREAQQAARGLRERSEVAGLLQNNFELIDKSNPRQRSDGKITQAEITNFRTAHRGDLTGNEMNTLARAARDFPLQIGRGKDAASRADVETYRISPPVPPPRRPSKIDRDEGIGEKVGETLDKVGGRVGRTVKGIFKRGGD